MACSKLDRMLMRRELWKESEGIPYYWNRMLNKHIISIMVPYQQSQYFDIYQVYADKGLFFIT